MEVSQAGAFSALAAGVQPPLSSSTRSLVIPSSQRWRVCENRSNSSGPAYTAHFPFHGRVDGSQRRRQVQVQLQIDRKRYFEESLRRQEEEEAREAEAEITCPVDCVREVRTYAEFERVLQEAELANTLVVVDFYNSSCGSCKYILPQFIKLCKRGCGEECPVEGEKGILFIKHNVRDDYDDLTDLARFYSIRTVPMFSFFVDGSRVEQFPTRDKKKLEQSVKNLLTRYFS
ncbi:unnamed protein product [Calypogeia fissa]